MSIRVRTSVKQSSYVKTRELVGYPKSATFDDALTELLRRYEKKAGEKK